LWKGGQDVWVKKNQASPTTEPLVYTGPPLHGWWKPSSSKKMFISKP